MLFQKTNAMDRVLYQMLGKYWLHLTLLSILIVWLFDVFYVAEEHTLVSALSTKNLPLFASVTLPSVPKISPTLALDMTASEPAPQILTTLAQASIIKTSKTQAFKVHATVNQAMLTSSVIQPTDVQVNNVIKQLTDLDSRHIQFLLPETNLAKKAFVNHMYRCENIQFGVITRERPHQLTLLSSERVQARAFQASELLRVAHDYLNRYERNLVTLYAQGNQPVRLFEMSFDVNLATKIAAVLGQKELQSFSARYFLERSQVGFTDIVLNHHAISENWIISSKKCY
ncbi:hypothetical protein [Glaciecola sp. 33A]|jgi:hypothetical protein|uniref:hypothetical protein n=1 Tax=Glaciecola sp. 33A TaxID=2057807 RepID=UPI000C31DD56|nr:hypothetical protein [Glaciecola sp. 33A]PKI02239.1 hypothetical protein CXF81_07945 [Glaciecola sp. 33A]